MAVQIQFRRGTAASWTAANTILAEGELGLETDTDLFKIGDGTTAWNSLGYAALNSTTISPTVIDAKGDLLVGTGDNTVDRVAVGTNGYFLKANSSATAGVEWAAIPTINNLDDVGDVTITSASNGQFLKWNGTAWVNDAIDLATDTTGNYMSDVSAGTGISVSHTPGEGSTATITNAGVTSVNGTTGAITGVVTTSDSGTVTSTMIADGTIVNADINASAAIALSKLASGTSAQIIVANGSGVPAYVTLSGDATISNTGVLTLANSSLSLDEISDVVISSASSNQLLQYNGTNWVNATVSTTPTWEDDQNVIANAVFS